MAYHAHQIKGEAHPLKRVVVVDDNEILLRAWKRILSRQACVYFTTNNPEEALEHLQKEGADLVVCDVVMPRMDGLELTAKIRANSDMADLPVILVTSLESRDDKERGLEVGANAYLVKSSFEQSNLLEFIQRLL